MLRLTLILALVGHILCGICDCLLSYTPNGRINLTCIKDSEKMRKEFEHMPLSYPLASNYELVADEGGFLVSRRKEK